MSARYITVDYDNGETKEYRLTKYLRSNHGTCINQRPIVDVGQRVEFQDVLADGPSTDHGEIALGRNILMGFMTWEGYNYEDAILLNERMVREDVFTSIHIEEYETEARDTKLGPETITRDIPNVGEDALKDLDEHGIIRVGAEVRAGDYLVGKVTPKGEAEATAEEKLLRAIFGEKAREVRDTSLKVPHGESGIIVDVKIFTRENGDELGPGVNQVRPGLYRPEAEDLRGRQDGRPPRQQGRGVPHPAPGGYALPARRHPPGHRAEPPGRALPYEHRSGAGGPPGLRRQDPGLEGGHPHLQRRHRGGHPGVPEDGRPGPRGGLRRAPHRQAALSGRRDRRERHASPHPEEMADKAQVREWQKAGQLRLVDGKNWLYDGRTGRRFDNPVTVGYVYFLKLHHLVDDKIHARATGPYSLVTQQPLGGKAQFGGQRFGEMEVWALEAYGAAYTLQEILTVKSDDVTGRVKTYEAIVKGHNVPKPGVPESFKVLIKELQSLCLDMKVLDAEGNEIELKDDDEDTYQPGSRDDYYDRDDDYAYQDERSPSLPPPAGFTFKGDSDDDDLAMDMDRTRAETRTASTPTRTMN